ncbi:MAG: hypothetical protein ACFE8M_10865 [Candidatus Hermodarchaeota archaeon]
MAQIYTKRKVIDNIAHRYNDVLKEIYKKIDQTINRKREIMYSDIINFLTKNQYKGEIYNQIIIWCNYNIKQGNYLVKIF